MIEATKPENELQRQAALLQYGILDTMPEAEYDNITKIATQICKAKMSTITLIDGDRQWFKSTYRLDAVQTARADGFCAHCILDAQNPTVVPDTRKDERFHDNVFVIGPTKFEFYAGVPLLTDDGYAIGTLCVLDDHPRDISGEQLETLEALARQVMQLFELRKTVKTLNESREQLHLAHQNLEEFCHIVSHDVKGPLRNIKMLTEAIHEDAPERLNETDKKYLDLINQTACDSIELLDGVLKYSQAIHFLDTDKEYVNTGHLISNLLRQINPPAHFEVKIVGELPTIFTSKVAFRQICENIISNAIKYNDKPQGEITISCKPEGGKHFFEIADNGRGIPNEEIEKIFSIFYMVNTPGNPKKQKSSGVGLSIVKKLVDSLKGKIEVASKPGKGTVFRFAIN